MANNNDTANKNTGKPANSPNQGHKGGRPPLPGGHNSNMNRRPGAGRGK
ncbi:MAG: hypothetical protein FWE37_06270 [Spirochaetaceae bacterium]|nr:hypothetical protein [Spirochaetaceae bacterium]